VVKRVTLAARVERASASRRERRGTKEVPSPLSASGARRVLHDATSWTKEYLAARIERASSSRRVSVVVTKECLRRSANRASEFFNDAERRGTKECLAASASSERVSSRRERRGTEEYLALRIERASSSRRTRSVVYRRVSSPLRGRATSSSRRGAYRGTKEYSPLPRQRASASRRGASWYRRVISTLRVERASFFSNDAERSWYRKSNLAAPHPRRASSSHERGRRGTKECLAAPHRASEFFTTRSVVVNKRVPSPSASSEASSFTTRERGYKITRSPPAVPVSH